jgi:HEAT repeat protein
MKLPLFGPSLPDVWKLKAKGNIKALTKALSYPNDFYHIRESAVRALGELKAIEPLIGALKGNSDSMVRGRAALELKQIGDPRAIEPLIGALNDEDAYVRWTAASALGQIGNPRAVDPLIGALKDRDPQVRWTAAGALGQIGDPRAMEPLTIALTTGDKDMRRRSAEALEQLGDARAVEPLIAALKDNDSDVRWKAASALRKIRDSRSVEPLIAALRDGEAVVREVAAEALGRIPDERTIEPLIAALDDVSAGVGTAASNSLADLLRDNAGLPSGRLASANANITRALQEAQSVRNLMEQLRSDSEVARAGAAKKLGESRTRCAIEPLIALFDDDYVWVQAEAASAVAKVGSAAIGPLDHAYRSGNDNVRRSVAHAFGELADPAAIEHLCAIARTCPNFNVRREAAYGISRREDAREFHQWAESIIASG